MRQEMKITVCFGTTKIIVPCGTQLPVRELIRQAVVRYKKVTNKHVDDYVHVHCLQTCDEEAILDEDDTVGDVLDDRDKVIASYEENLVSRPGHNGGDGTSTSSVGTTSPDIFQGEMTDHCSVEGIPVSSTRFSDNQFKKMSNVHNNKSSSSSVKYIESFSPRGSHDNHVEDVRLSTNRGLLEGRSSGSDIEGSEGMLNDSNCSDHEDDEDSNELSAFRREPVRKSLKSNHLDRWIGMQESYSEYKRHEPTGAPPSPDDKYTASETGTRCFDRQLSLALSEAEDAKHLEIVLKPTMGEDLGITVQGYKTADDRELGLIVFHIDPKGCAARDGRVQVADRIVTVNNQDLTNISNERAEEAFSKALQCDIIELGISRSHSFIPENQGIFSSIGGTSAATTKDEDEADKIEEERNTVSPLPKFSTQRYEEALSPRRTPNDVVPRIVEKRMVIELQKGNDGLGFSVTSRDNPAGGNCPIYVKNILPLGAAVCDGRLQAGDQILEVDGVQMTGKSQKQAVTILRSTKGQVKLQIKRKFTVTSPIGPKDLIKDIERAPSDSRGNKILTFRIPLPSSGTAGLGITVKGKSSTVEQSEAGGDLGIFVKTVVPGGAAQQDCRLHPDDQLISVNGVKLTGMSNSSAMKTLRSAMEEKALFSSVEVTVIRTVKEILNTVSDLESISQRANSVDRAIDVGKTRDEGRVVVDGTTYETKQNVENESSWAIKIKSKGDDTEELQSNCKPVSRSEPKEATSLRQPVLNNDPFIKSNRKPLEDETMELNSNRKPTSEDKTTELKTYRKPAKLGNGVHRNRSYYIAMNRSGQRERPSKGSRALAKYPFYQPQDELSSKSEQNADISRADKDEKPKIVIASYRDAVRVATPTRAFCISQRPTSTVAEPTSAMSTATPTRSLHSSEASVDKGREKSTSKRQTDSSHSKRFAAVPVSKATPPPPPPRTSRPSPYVKQFPNYLPANARALQKSDSAFSEYSGGSKVSSLPSSRASSNDVKILSATEVKTENNQKENTSNSISSVKTKEPKPVDENDREDVLSDEEVNEQEPFLREGFGRQSMSEKRFKLAQADITQTEFYKQRVTRSKSLEDAHLQLNPPTNSFESKTLPRPTTNSINKEQRNKPEEQYNERLIETLSRPTTIASNKEQSKRNQPKEEYNERLIDYSSTCRTWSNKDSRFFKDLSKVNSFEQSNGRGQWRTSSDGVVKKYGRHGNFIKASPLASTKNSNVDPHSDGSLGSADEAIPITMQSNADYNSVHPKVKKKQSPFNLKVLGAALKPKAYKGKYDMQSRQAPESPSEPRVEFPDEQRYRQLLLGETRERSLSETFEREKIRSSDWEDNRSVGGARRRKGDQGKRSTPGSIQDFLKKGSGEYSITESAQI